MRGMLTPNHVFSTRTHFMQYYHLLVCLLSDEARKIGPWKCDLYLIISTRQIFANKNKNLGCSLCDNHVQAVLITRMWCLHRLTDQSEFFLIIIIVSIIKIILYLIKQIFGHQLKLIKAKLNSISSCIYKNSL